MTSDDRKTPQNSGETAVVRNDRAENLRPYQFRPGQTGNPGGRPRTKLLRRVILELVSAGEDEEGLKPNDRLREVARNLVDIAAGQGDRFSASDIAAFVALRDTLDGKPVADDEGRDAAPVVVNVIEFGPDEDEK